MPGLAIPRIFSDASQHPFEAVEWDKRHAKIVGEGGKTVFEQEEVEFPTFWSDQATNIVASKYFRMVNGEREYSVRQMIKRVVHEIATWGRLDGYFDTDNYYIFYDELTHILLHQMASFNSPVWFNIGVDNTAQQCSACYILSVEDSMESILGWYYTEGMIFKGGSGAGVNLSNLRPENSHLSSGGKASGPVSFMRGADTNAGIIKSAGSTRRAAKKIILNVDHPDIEKFIECKVKAEEMARVLIQAGYKDGLEAEVRETIPFQNANNDVGITDLFMRSLDKDEETCVTTSASLLRKIAQANWACGDPNMFFVDIANAWHTCPNSGNISSSNPCTEFVFLDNSACNLASINLLKFLKPDNTFDIPAFKHTIDILITAQDILVDRSSYPTEKIAQNSRDFRPLGLGYANLGALLMAKGLPYDSDEGRDVAAAVTSLQSAEAYAQSARLAGVKGAFAGFEANREAMHAVIGKHRHAAYNLGEDVVAVEAMGVWDEVYAAMGYRNAQVTLIAPTGTISFMMDCDTTGVEPDIALVKEKKLVGGGTLMMVNQTVPRALVTLGYDEDSIYRICADLYDNGILNGLHPNHLPVFDCAFPAWIDGRCLSWEAHVKMVAAVQPFLSGGVSKTVNMPANSTVEDIEKAFVMAWELGLKSIAVYRDGCKAVQPVTTQQHKNTEALRILKEIDKLPPAHYDERDFPPLFSPPARKRLPDERPALNHKFNIAGHEGYINVGNYPDTGEPGELFIHMAKEGSTVSGLMDTVGILTSLLLQYGVPLNVLADKLKNSRFEPSGITTNEKIRMATSPVDYVFRWLAEKFGGETQHTSISDHSVSTSVTGRPAVFPNDILRNDWHREAQAQGALAAVAHSNGHAAVVPLDAPVCSECGNLMSRRAGACFVCDGCGCSSGCS